MTVDLVPGLKNVVGVRATDLAGNDVRESPKFGILYEPGLGTPQAHIDGPDDGDTIDGKVRLEWEGGYIEPDRLSFEVHIEDPKGGEIIHETSTTSFEFTPTYPGQYTWWIVSKAEGMTNETSKRTFVYTAPLFIVVFGETPEAISGSELAMKVTVSNPLEVILNLTFSFIDLKGFTLEGGSDLELAPDEEKETVIALGTNGKDPATYTFKLNATDEYGRSVIIDVKAKINPQEEKEDNNTDEEDFPILIIVVIAVIVIIVIAILIFLVTRKKKEEEIEEEEEEEQPISLDYDPTGVVASGGSGVESSVPLAPGMNVTEEEMRMKGSNVMEISLPAADEPQEEEIVEGVMSEE
jgi:hypothetical protein